ncbi:MAG: ferritin family protein [Deltaproteobacteria bacterium]|nr:ferritin family protein [Deltaproteobacteria bacterium]
MEDSIRKEIAKGLEHAIRTETDGQHFYMMAAKATEDPKGQEVFGQLAEEEKDHRRFLEHQRWHILEHGKVDSAFKIDRRVDLSGDNPIFSESLVKRAKEAHYEMSALSIGIQLEINSQKYYEEQAEAAKLPEIEKFYRFLATWESEHHQALLRQQDSLKEDYWADAHFAPF